MTTLLLCGTGSTGLKLAHLLRNANIPVLITSRTGKAPDDFPAVRFDWSDSSTFSSPFQDHQIEKIYFIGPRVLDILSAAKPFIDLAIEKGVKQWVIIGGTIDQPNEQGTPPVHRYLIQKGVDCALLRATWFSDNFSAYYGDSIRTKNELVSTAQDARIPFVASEDVAKAAFEVFTTGSKELRNASPYVVGPELCSYDEAAAILSGILARKITHRRLSPEEMVKYWVDTGLPEGDAEFTTWLEVQSAEGTEEAAFNAKDKYVGKKTLREYFVENKHIWLPSI